MKEEDIQPGILAALRMQFRDTIFVAVPNGARFGGKNPAITAARLKRQGMIPGAADILALWATGCGAIEVKRPKTATNRKGVQAKDQKTFEADCHEKGIPYVVVTGPNEALNAMREWRCP